MDMSGSLVSFGNAVHSPSISEIRLMRSMYEQGASPERVGNRFGYTAGAVRKHLIAAGVTMRDTHGRV